jgi:hypothetical protein
MPPSSTQQFSGIFVSYRRDDTSGHAGRLADRLVEHFGRDRIFMDIDTIEPGEDFVTVIENAVGSCDILIAVIGRNWISANGSGRFDNPNNFVRLEISTALRRDIRVVPVLVQRASMPKPQDLPEDLVKLTRRNAVELSDLRWQSDVDQLIRVMERVLAKRAKAKQLAGANHADPVRAEQERGQIEEVDTRKAAEVTQRSEEGETAEECHVGEARVDGPDFTVREDAPATIVAAGAAAPAYKHRQLMLIAGTCLIVLLVATIVLWRSQRAQGSVNTNFAPTPQPTSVTQPTPANPTPTPELKASPTPAPVAFGEPTLWKRDDTGTILKIVWEGKIVKAIIDTPSESAKTSGRKKGDLAFDGTYEGRTIKGTAYLLFSPEEVSRCRSFSGDQKFDLKLTLSEDGNKLTGSREDYKVSDDCNIIVTRRRKLSYTRTSVDSPRR